MPDFLTIQDLYARVGARRINGFFDDTNNGELTDESTTAINDVLDAAEGLYYGVIQRAYPGNPREVGSAARTLVANDAMVKMQVAWLAVELAAERRQEFTDAEGWGPFKAQYQRADKYLHDLSIGIKRSPGESLVGKGANTGSPGISPPDLAENPFTFAPSKGAPSGHGGF